MSPFLWVLAIGTKIFPNHPSHCIKYLYKNLDGRVRIHSKFLDLLALVLYFFGNRFKMSWQDHVDKQLIAHGFTHAAIIGLDGNVWAKSAAFNVEPAELQTFASNYKNEFKHFQEFGITLAGERFIFLSGIVFFSIFNEPIWNDNGFGLWAYWSETPSCEGKKNPKW